VVAEELQQRVAHLHQARLDLGDVARQADDQVGVRHDERDHHEMRHAQRDLTYLFCG
jgi:hypothetical protein